MRIFGDDAHDEDGQLVLQSDTLLVGDAGREALQAAVDVENHLVVLDVRLQLIDAGHRLHVVRTDINQQRPDAASQVVVHQAVVAQRKRLPHVVGGRAFVCQGCFDAFTFGRLLFVLGHWRYYYEGAII